MLHGVQDAVELALQIDRAAAVAVANRPQDDPALQRKLWLAIARHLIHSASDAPPGTPVSPFLSLVPLVLDLEECR